jgi:uncharacterized linocin/CFP29 family protein
MLTQVSNGQSPVSIPREFLNNGVLDRARMYRALVDNGVLREDQTRQIEETLTRVARRDLRAVARLREAGLMVDLRNIGVTSYEFDRVAPVGEATQSMSILAAGDRDLVRFSRSSIPVPVTISQFELDARHRAAGQNLGQPIDLTNLEEHTRSVAEKMEDTLVNGSPDIILNGQGLPGYTNFSARHQVSYSDVAWDEISGDPEAAIVDVLAMRTALRNDGFVGPYDLYVSADYDGVLDKDYKSFSERTLRERLLAIDGVNQIIVLPTLGAQQVLMVQMTSSVVVWANGQDITSVTWDLMGGLADRWAVMNVGAPALKVSFAREPLSNGVLPALSESSGIAHLS